MLELGPILAFRGCTVNEWQLSAIVVSKSDCGELQWSIGGETGSATPDPLYTLNGRTVWRFAFSLPLSHQETVATYNVCGRSHRVSLPAAGSNSRFFYASCNGFSSLKLMKTVRDKNAMWKELATRHANVPCQLLLLGGDQVYADSMWETVAPMKAWNELPFQEGNRMSFTTIMKTRLNAFYFDLYCQRWRQPEVAAVLAEIPMIAMWDDHDIIDGWGSYPPDRQNCPVFKGIFAAARTAFAVFQQHLKADDSEPAFGAIARQNGFTRAHVIGKIAVLALDMRSERSADAVLSAAHWKEVYDWLEALDLVDHLLLMSSIPVVYPGFDTIEKILGIIPGHQDLEDDLRDHWNSRPHKGERLRLIHRLLNLCERMKVRPTILSGDVHVGAVGVIESTRSGSSGYETAVNQLISSSIVHPGPPAVVLFALRYLFDSSDEVDRGILARMMKFPGLTHSFIGNRNFMSLEPDEGRRIWANWFVEGEDHPYVKVIHAHRDRS